MKRKNHNNRHVELPNFCHLGVNLRIALTVEAALVAGVVARVADTQAFWPSSSPCRALAQPALLLTLLALCAAGALVAQSALSGGCGIHAGAGHGRARCWRTLWLTPLLAGTQKIPPAGVALFALLLGAASCLFQPARPCAVACPSPKRAVQALQARIRPHFLFNSLNAVLSLVRSDPRRAERALENMAELFRALMGNASQLAPLEDEVALTRAYWNWSNSAWATAAGDLAINKMRGDALIPAAGNPAAGGKMRSTTASSRSPGAVKSVSTSTAVPTRCTSWCETRSLPMPATTRATALRWRNIPRAPAAAFRPRCPAQLEPLGAVYQYISSFPTPVNAPSPPLRVLIVDDEAPARHACATCWRIVQPSCRSTSSARPTTGWMR